LRRGSWSSRRRSGTEAFITSLLERWKPATARPVAGQGIALAHPLGNQVPPPRCPEHGDVGGGRMIRAGFRGHC
jgi:hypothetical protein